MCVVYVCVWYAHTCVSWTSEANFQKLEEGSLFVFLLYFICQASWFVNFRQFSCSTSHLW